MNDAIIPTLTHATERDIDLVLVEELFASPLFAGWMFRQANLPDDLATSRVLHSKRRTRSRREIDIFVEGQTRSGARVALLIENKLDAEEQPDQAESYREELAVLADHYASAAMVLVCPETYRQAHGEFAGKFDAVISYERVVAYFAERTDRAGPDAARMRFRRDLMEQAISKARRGYEPVPLAEIGGFNAHYVALLQSLAPSIHPGPSMLKEANPAESVSMIFDHNRSLAFLPEEIRPSRFSHELGRGSSTRANYVAVVFPGLGAALATLRDQLERDTAALGASFSAKTPSKLRPRPGLVMACPTRPIDNQKDFGLQKEALELGIATALRMQTWLRENQPILQRWMQSAREVMSRS